MQASSAWPECVMAAGKGNGCNGTELDLRLGKRSFVSLLSLESWQLNIFAVVRAAVFVVAIEKNATDVFGAWSTQLNSEQCCPISLFYSLPYGVLQSSMLVTPIFCGGLQATLAQHANQLATPALSQFIFTLSRTTFAGQHMAKGSLDVCARVCVCVFDAVKMLPVSISHFVFSCSFNGFIFPAKLEKFSGFSLPLRVGHSTRCHPAHSQHRRLCATSAASWLLLIMCPTNTRRDTLSAQSKEHSAYSIKL